MHVNVGCYYNASATESSEKKPTNVLMLSRWTPYCVAIGCFLDILSTFLPWGTNLGQELFLPFSIPLPLGWNAPNVADAPFVLFVSIAIRLAAILGFAALLLDEYLKSILPTLVLLASVGLSFSCFIISSQFGWSLSSGAYTALFGGLLKLLGLILRNLHVEIAEEENNAKNRSLGLKRSAFTFLIVQEYPKELPVCASVLVSLMKENLLNRRITNYTKTNKK